MRKFGTFLFATWYGAAAAFARSLAKRAWVRVAAQLALGRVGAAGFFVAYIARWRDPEAAGAEAEKEAE